MATSQYYGVRQGGAAANAQCANGGWMTGLRVGEDGTIRRWGGIYCQTPQEIAQGANRVGSYVAPNGGTGTGGRDVEFHCPAGSYIQNIVTEHDDGVKRLGPVCVSLQTGQTTAKDSMIGGGTGREPVGNFNCGAYNGVETTADGVLRQVRYSCSQDAAQVRKNFYTAEGKARCCMGLEKEGSCQNRPQSGECDRFMSGEFCPMNPTHPFCTCLRSPVPCPNKFDGRCITNNGYRTRDMLQAPCPDVITCQQFVTFGPEARVLATRVEQNCPVAGDANKQSLPERGLPPGSEMGGEWTWLWILLIVVILLTLMGAGAWWALSEEETTPGEGRIDANAKEEATSG